MRKLFFLLVAVACLGLVGCASKPASIDEARVRYGALPENYQELVINYFDKLLIEPGSGMYSFGSLPGREVQMGQDGWLITFFINAKNRMGGYTGNQLAMCKIINGQVVQCVSSGRR